jgi:hypothetical protein
VASLSFAPPGGRWVAGNEVLIHLDKSYPKEKFYRVRQHTLRLVLTIIRQDIIQPPLNWNRFGEVRSALDVFIGYLMLDAWVSNQDRHHENWGFIVSPEITIHLAPTFDHASSLGWNETDGTRTERLTTRDSRRNMDRYVERAVSAFFSSPASDKPMSTWMFLGKRQDSGRKPGEPGLNVCRKSPTMILKLYSIKFLLTVFRTLPETFR